MHLSRWSPSDKLSTRLDNELDVNLKLIDKFIDNKIYFVCDCFTIISSFLIGTEKVIYFSVFSQKHSNW